MIKQIRIKNFQRHKALTLDFQSGVNTITGASDSGKSSVVRALYWLVFNRPSGDDFRTWGTNTTEVTVVTDEHTITRKKSKDFNGYLLDGQEHAAVGREVPEPIQNAINLSAINFQCQHDSPFLLSSTPGDVGKQLNSLVDLSIIDTTISGLNRRTRDRAKTVSVLDETLKQQKEVLAHFADLPKATKKLKEITSQHGVYQGSMAKSLQIQATLRECYKQEELTKNCTEITQAIDTIEVIERWAENKNDKKIKIEALQRVISRYNGYAITSEIAVEEALSEINMLLERSDKLSADKRKANKLLNTISVYSSASDKLSLVEGADEALRSLGIVYTLNRGVVEGASRTALLERFIRKLTTGEKRLQLAATEEKLTQEEHTALYGGNCPLCGHSMAG